MRKNPNTSRPITFRSNLSGLNTEHVESLSSYVARLAEAHSVTPTRLLYHATTARETLPFVVREASISNQIAKNMNMFGETAEIIGNLMTVVTGVETLKQLSLRPLSNFISNNSLHRAKKFWCAFCLADSLGRKQTIYEKLVWIFNRFSVCLIHKCFLKNLCPGCRQPQNYLHRNARVGFCQYCFGFLGNTSYYTHSKNKEIKPEYIRDSQKINDLVCDLSKFSNNEPENLSKNLEFCINRVSMGSINDFVYKVGLSHMTIRRILQNKHKPTVSTLLDICHPLDISLQTLFSGQDIEFGNNCNPGIAEGLRNYRETMCISGSSLTTEDYLQNLLQVQPPLSGKEAARRLNWRDSKLYRTFPTIYRKFVKQYKEFHSPEKEFTDEDVKKALSKAFKEHPPPSLQSVFRELGIKDNGYKYQQQYKWLCRRISRNFNAYRSRLSKGEDEAQLIIREALTEEPPPSISELSRRLHIKRDRINKLFPLESELLSKRSYEYIVRERKIKLLNLNKEIENIVRELQLRYIYPSENKIKDRLSSGYRDADFKKILKRVKIKYR